MKTRFIKMNIARSLMPVLAIFLIVISTSCKRSDGTTVVEGQVVDKYTGKGIPDATVGVYSTSTSSMGGFNHKELEKQADGKGNFSFSFDSEDSRDYALIASKGSSYAANYANPLILKEDRNNKKLKLRMEPLAWIRIKLVNTPPKDVLSYLAVWGFNLKQGQIGIEFHQINNDTSFIGSTIGNSHRRVNWSINRNGTIEDYFKEIFYPALDTVDVTIEY